MAKRIVLIQPPNLVLASPDMYFALSLLYLGAVLEKAGHNVQVVDLRTTKKINASKQIPKADYVGITSTTGEIEDAKEIAKQVKKHYGEKITTIVGGAHPSLMAEDCVNDFDCCVIGEGEEAIIKIVNENIRGMIQCEPIKNLDTIPFPARHLIGEKAFSYTLWPGEKYGYGERATSIMGTRGCPFNCHFCGNWDRRVRYRSPENVAEEVKEIKEKYNCHYLRFEDDNFTLNKKWLLQTCEALKPLKIHYKCHTRSKLLDEEMCEALRQSGCQEMGLGVETADDYILERLNKQESVEDHKRAIRLIKQAGIRAKTYLIAGLPFETWGTIETIKQFMIETKPDRWTLSLYCCYPGSEIWRHPEKFGVTILTKDFRNFWNFSDRSWIETDVASNDELTAHYRHLYAWLRSEEWKK